MNSIDECGPASQGVSSSADTPSLRFDSGLAEEVLRARGKYGRLTELARDLDVDRRRLYEVRELAREALAEAFDLPGEQSPAAEQVDVCDDDRVLFYLPVTAGYLKRFVIALRVITPASIRDIVSLMLVLFGQMGAWSFGTIQKVLSQAGERARAFSGGVDLSSIDGIVLDEMFSQNRPVLAGLDPMTQYLFLSEVRDSRTGEDWNEALEKLREAQHLNPKRVVKDAGSGLANGVTTTWPGIEQRDDAFHAILKCGKARFYLERRALGAIANEYECEEKREQCKSEATRRRKGQEWRGAKERAVQAVERFDTFEKHCQEAELLLKLTPPGTGELYLPEVVSSGLKRIGLAMMEVGGSHARSAGRYLKNRAPGLALYLQALRRELSKVTEAAGGEAMTKAATRLYQAVLDGRSKTGPDPRSRAAKDELRAAIRHLAAQANGDAARVQQAMKIVFPVLDQRERASSAIENFNSVLRPYLVVHKNVEQNFLDLFSFYWNTRKREWGRHKGTSAYSQLTGICVPDWLTLLGYPNPATSAAALN